MHWSHVRRGEGACSEAVRSDGVSNAQFLTEVKPIHEVVIFTYKIHEKPRRKHKSLFTVEQNTKDTLN